MLTARLLKLKWCSLVRVMTYIGCKTGLNRFNDICNHLTLTHNIYYTLHNFSNSYILSASDCINTLQIYSLKTIKFLYITIDCHLIRVLCYRIHMFLKGVLKMCSKMWDLISRSIIYSWWDSINNCGLGPVFFNRNLNVSLWKHSVKDILCDISINSFSV